MKKVFITILDLCILGLLGFASYRTAEAQDYLGAFLVFAPVGLIIIRNAVSKE
jgi:hypothetical protein